MMVNVGNEVYAIPITNIVGTVHPKFSDIKLIERQEVLLWHKTEIPLLRLHELFNLPVEEKDKTPLVVVVEKGDKQVGLGVDHITGQQETIIKPLDPKLKGIKGLSGATILGDGRVALILDIGTLIEYKK